MGQAKKFKTAEKINYVAVIAQITLRRFYMIAHGITLQNDQLKVTVGLSTMSKTNFNYVLQFHTDIALFIYVNFFFMILKK